MAIQVVARLERSGSICFSRVFPEGLSGVWQAVANLLQHFLLAWTTLPTYYINLASPFTANWGPLKKNEVALLMTLRQVQIPNLLMQLGVSEKNLSHVMLYTILKPSLSTIIACVKRRDEMKQYGKSDNC